jgi:drug/metabolite transporter (DMT)-like permease
VTSRGWALFAAVSVVWGVPYFFVKVAVDADVPPAVVAWSRVVIAAAILLPLAVHRGALHGLRGRRAPIVAYAACEIAIPFTLISVGEQHVSSSLTAILIASMPLMVALLALRFTAEEPPRGLRLVGLVAGLGGVVVLFGGDVAGDSSQLLGAVLILAATLCYAIAPVIVERRLADLDPLGPVAAGLGVAALALTPAAIVAPPDALSFDAAASLAMLGVVCTAAGLVLFFALIAEAGPSRASVITYVNPAVALLLGVLVLDEALGAASLAGLTLILAGSWLATGGREPASASPHG